MFESDNTQTLASMAESGGRILSLVLALLGEGTGATSVAVEGRVNEQSEWHSYKRTYCSKNLLLRYLEEEKYEDKKNVGGWQQCHLLTNPH